MSSAAIQPAAPNGSNPSGAPALSSPPPPEIPDHELLRCIGRGSYGEVWLARNVLGDYRAVKVVYRRNFEDDRPFEREFEGIKKFEPISRTHDSQVDILHVGRNERAGYFYYVMELADDVNSEPVPHSAFRNPHLYSPLTLKSDLAHRGRLSLEDCLQIGLALTTALEHLHSHGLVHRDIKPSNIIFVGGIPKLADIGLVASVDATRSFVGTAGYLPPEGPGKPAGDLYSLGKVLYEMSVGRDRQDFPALPEKWEEFADAKGLLEFNAIVLQACANDPRERYQSAKEMRADLEQLQLGKSLRRKRNAERAFRLARKVVPFALATAAVLMLLLPRVSNLSLQRSNAPASLVKASIFVLPFRSEGTNSIPDDLRGRMTDAFIDALPLINGVKTGPRKSGWVHQNEDELRHSLAKTNDARHILTGRIAGGSNMLTLTVRLYERQSDQPLWSESHSGTTNQVVALEQHAIEHIASRLGLKISAIEQRQIDQLLANNLKALTLMRQARAVYSRKAGTQIGYNEVMQLAQKALSVDRNYLDADHFDAYMLRNLAQDRAPVEIYPVVLRRMNDILSKDDTHAGALDQTGCAWFLSWDWATFDSFTERLLRSVSGQQEHFFRAFLLRERGRFREARIEQELTEHPEPTDTDIRFFMASSRWVERHYDEGVAVARRTLELYPDHAEGYFWLAHCLVAKGDYEQGIPAIQKAQEVWEKQELIALLGFAYARMNQTEEARKILQKLQELKRTKGYLQPYFAARVHAALGENQKALDLLEQAAEDRSEYLLMPDMGGLRTDLAWDGLQNEPRYWKLCERIGLGKNQWPR